MFSFRAARQKVIGSNPHALVPPLFFLFCFFCVFMFIPQRKRHAYMLAGHVCLIPTRVLNVPGWKSDDCAASSVTVPKHLFHPFVISVSVQWFIQERLKVAGRRRISLHHRWLHCIRVVWNQWADLHAGAIQNATQSLLIYPCKNAILGVVEWLLPCFPSFTDAWNWSRE